MDVVLGIAAKSLDAAHQLAKVLNGPGSGWAWQEPIGLQTSQASPSSGPEAAARLLLSQDRRTAYVLVATHASAGELLRAVAHASHQRQQQRPLPPQPSRPDVEESAAPVDLDADSDASALVPPLQRLQQHHETAVNVLLLQLFLACDSVLVMLPTGQGLGLAATGGGGAGGPLSGATEWMSRLRLLQGAKRALRQSLGGGNGGGGSADGSDGLSQLRAWCGRARPPVLFFVSPSDPSRELGATAPPPPQSPATGEPRSAPGRAAAAAASAAAADPRDANALFRTLLKRCRPVPPSAGPSSDSHTSSQLCLFDPAALVLEPGPLVLEPAAVQAVVLAVWLEPEEGGSAAAAESEVRDTSGRRREGDGVERLREALEAALEAATEAEGGSKPAGGQAFRGGGGGEAAGAAAAARRFAAGWRAAAGALHVAAVAAWRAAAGQPLDWVPPGLEGGGLRQTPTPGHVASTAHGRPRPRAGQAPAPLLTPAGASGPRAQSSLESAAAWLAAAAGGGGLAARLAAELCREAAEAALRQYGAAAAPRYPERVHAAAVAAAVAALRAAAPPGPAAGTAVARLRAACEEAWRRPGAGRRQCSALSATGRPCSRPLHDASEPHSSETTCWVAATSTGSQLVALADPFDLQAANASPQLDDGGRVTAPPPPSQRPSSAVTPAAAVNPAAANSPAAAAAAGAASGGRAKGGRRAAAATAAAAAAATEPGAGATPPPPSSPHLKQQQQQQHLQQQQQQQHPSHPVCHSRHFVVAVAQAADGSTHQCALGPWVTVTRLGPASSYNERRGLANQPGLNGSCLHPLTLHMEAEPGAAGQQRSGTAGRGGAGSRGAGRLPVPKVESVGQGAADVAGLGGGSGGSDSDLGVVLDEQSFPSLAEAAAAAQGGRQQQQPARAGLGGPMGQRRAGGGGGGGSSKQQADGGKAGRGGSEATVAALSKERERLAKAWPYPYGTGAGAASRAGGASGAARGAADGGVGGAAARGRRGRGGAGPASGVSGGGADAAAFPPLANSRDVRRVYFSYEYETLDGRRFLATPQQLAAGAVAAAPVREAPVRGGTPPLAAAPCALPTPPHPPNQQAQRRGPKPSGGASGSAQAATAAAAAAAAALGSGGGGGGGSGAATFLLQHDAPLYLQPPPGLQPEPTGPSAQDGAPGWDPTPRRPGGLAQLRRILVVTPPSASGEPLLAARPTVQFRAVQLPQLPRDAAAAAGLQPAGDDGGFGAGLEVGGGGGGGDAEGADRDGLTSSRRAPASDGAGGVLAGDGDDEQVANAAQLVSGRGPAAAVVHVSLARPVPLPPDSFVVVSLPYLYGLPAEWLGWGQGLGEGRGAGGGGDAEGFPVRAEAEAGGAGASEGMEVQGAGGGGGAGLAHGPVESHGPLVPLVQLDERTPYEARLLAGSALFPVPVVQV